LHNKRVPKKIGRLFGKILRNKNQKNRAAIWQNTAQQIKKIRAAIWQNTAQQIKKIGRLFGKILRNKAKN